MQEATIYRVPAVRHRLWKLNSVCSFICSQSGNSRLILYQLIGISIHSSYITSYSYVAICKQAGITVHTCIMCNHFILDYSARCFSLCVSFLLRFLSHSTLPMLLGCNLYLVSVHARCHGCMSIVELVCKTATDACNSSQ